MKNIDGIVMFKQFGQVYVSTVYPGVHLTFEIQEKAGGIAEALGLARDFADKGHVTVILGRGLLDLCSGRVKW
jgi:dTDP-glucose pyrophosphorylase